MLMVIEMKILMYFIPALAGLDFYLYLRKEKLSNMETIVKYGTITILTNIIALGYVYFVSEYKYTLLTNLDNTLSFTVKYMLLGLVSSLISGYLLYIVGKSVELDVEVNRRKKQEKIEKKKVNSRHN